MCVCCHHEILGRFPSSPWDRTRIPPIRDHLPPQRRHLGRSRDRGGRGLRMPGAGKSGRSVSASSPGPGPAPTQSKAAPSLVAVIGRSGQQERAAHWLRGSEVPPLWPVRPRDWLDPPPPVLRGGAGSAAPGAVAAHLASQWQHHRLRDLGLGGRRPLPALAGLLPSLSRPLFSNSAPPKPKPAAGAASDLLLLQGCVTPLHSISSFSILLGKGTGETFAPQLFASHSTLP